MMGVQRKKVVLKFLARGEKEIQAVSKPEGKKVSQCTKLGHIDRFSGFGLGRFHARAKP
jgi:hypothetical protein